MPTFFFPFLASPWHTEFPGQRSDASHSCAAAAATPDHLTTVLDWGSNLRPSPAEMLLIPHHTVGSPENLNFKKCSMG